MRLTDRIDNKIRHFSSRRSEVNKVEGIRGSIEAENEAIRELLYQIGQHFWKLYNEGRYTPGEEDRAYFEDIDRRTEDIRILTKQIDECKIEGIRERERIDADIAARAAERERLAEERRAEKECLAEERRQEREREQAEREERRRIEREQAEAEREEQRRGGGE